MYASEMYRKAERILESRRDNAVMEAELRSEEIRNSLPAVSAIQKQLSQIGLELSRLFFHKDNAPAKVEELRTRSKALVAERGKLLQQNGYREDAMQPHYVCSVCEDRGFISGRMCACHKQLLKELMREEVGKTAPLNKCTFENFDLSYYTQTPDESGIVPRERAEKILEAARRYAQNFTPERKNLLFLGKTGLGKTHLSLAILNVVINRGYSVCYGTSQNICDDLQAEQFGRGDTAVYSKRQVLESDLLVLDDLGTEPENQYSLATIYNIINSRILAGKPTIISTNYELPQLLKKYDQRITSRVTGEYTKMQILGSDIRNR